MSSNFSIFPDNNNDQPTIISLIDLRKIAIAIAIASPFFAIIRMTVVENAVHPTSQQIIVIPSSVLPYPSQYYSATLARARVVLQTSSSS